MYKALATAALAAASVQGHSGFGRPDFGQFASPNPYAQLHAFQELISESRSLASLSITQFENELDHRDRLNEMTERMNRYEATSMQYTDFYYSNEGNSGIQRLCLQKGETVEIEMTASEDGGSDTADFDATVSVDSSTEAEARVLGSESLYLLYRYTADADDTDVTLEFDISPSRTFDDLFTQYSAKIYKNEPD